jgi:ethanolamine utilization microcompartment shell protein EutL
MAQNQAVPLNPGLGPLQAQTLEITVLTPTGLQTVEMQVVAIGDPMTGKSFSISSLIASMRAILDKLEEIRQAVEFK